jgi:hypothetical protein
MGFLVEFDGIEEVRIRQRSIHLAGENRPKVDQLAGSILEPHTKSEGGNPFEPGHSVDLVLHVRYLRGSILKGSLPACKAFQH